MQKGITEFTCVVRWNTRRHADGNAGSSVSQQVWKRRGQYNRLTFFAVVGIPEIDGILVDAIEQCFSNFREARFRVTHRRGVIAVDVSEIPLSVYQRIPRRERLSEADQRVVDRLVAVRMILADDVADNPGALLEALVWIQPKLLHGIQQAPVNGFQAVANVG